jgi:hypothetical protein
MRLYSGTAPDAEVLFPIHPTAQDHYRDFLLASGAGQALEQHVPIWAVATSSTRTVLAWPDGAPEAAVFIKTSLHSEIFGDRRVQRTKAARSVGLSAMLKEDRADLPESLDYLPEPFAITARGGSRTGAIMRSIPAQIMSGRTRVVPLFALLGGTGEHRPVLPLMLERSGLSPQQFMHDVLCEPFAKLWLTLSMDFGLVIEAHGQDLLLELSPQLLPTGRLYFRDLEGLQVDWELRRLRGRSIPEHLPHAWQWSSAYAAWGDGRYHSLLWFKWRISLLQYLRFVLYETECSLRQWCADGIVGGEPMAEDEATMLFSQQLFAAIERRYGTTVGVPFNIHRNLNRFLLLLAKVRRDIISAPAAQAA